MLLLLSCSLQKKEQPKEIKGTTWAILPFVKVDSLNPILLIANAPFAIECYLERISLDPCLKGGLNLISLYLARQIELAR
jgi:hypothetical protein